MWREWTWRIILVSTAIDAAYLALLPVLSFAGWGSGQVVDAAVRARGEYYGMIPVLLLIFAVLARVMMAGIARTPRARMFAFLSLIASALWVMVVVEEQAWIMGELRSGTWLGSAHTRLLICEMVSFVLAAIAFAAAVTARNSDPAVVAKRKPAPRPKLRRARPRHADMSDTSV